MKKERKLIGNVGVDSAILMIVDPRYVEYEGEVKEELLLTCPEDGPCDLNHAKPYVEIGFGGATGVAFDSGLGDGIYEVYATTHEVGAWGKRITKVEIILIDDDELDLYRDDSKEGGKVEEPKLALVEGDTVTEFESYTELLNHVITQTYEISVNSPEEYDLLDEKDRSRLEAVHNAWL